MTSIKQEEQVRTRKKHERTDDKQEITDENKKNHSVTLYEAKKQIFSLIQQGWNYRKISQVSLLIEGLGMKRFSISEISKIKNEFLGGSRNVVNSSENSRDGKSEIFRLIKNGTNLEDIVIFTGKEPKFVKETFDEYMNLKNLSPSLAGEIMQVLDKKGIRVNDTKMLVPFITKTIDAYKFLSILQYQCCICKKPMSLSPYGDNKGSVQDIADAIGYLSKTHGHPEC
ncbi:MAG: hypothetical protein LV477_11565 [Candidatus Nitrosotalea sp.]|nr:hypothetical protein [Candidatus Nitrosotalea sp.]